MMLSSVPSYPSSTQMPPQTSFEGEFCKLHVRVKCTTQFGQTVAIAGNLSSLGNFENARALKLVTTPESYPVWFSAEPVIVPKGVPVNYIYCIFEGGLCKAEEQLTDLMNSSVRTVVPHLVDETVEDQYCFPTHLQRLGSNDTDANFDHDKSPTPTTPHDQKSYDLVNIMESGRLIIICYHLPVMIERSPQGSFIITWSDSLIAKSQEGSITGTIVTWWLGKISVPGGFRDAAEEAALKEQLLALNCIPIFVDTEVAKLAYHGFCKKILWPMFHNVDLLDQIHSAWNLEEANIKGTALGWETETKKYKEAYEALNLRFSEALIAHLQPKDVVWVHDYHLMLVPKHIRDSPIGEVVSIVFFLHIPFPTSQIFRSLPAANEILTSLINADVVGFHAFDHARHFLNAAKRILGLRSHTRQGGLLTVLTDEREVLVTVSHASIETALIDKVLADPTTHQLAQLIKNKFKGRKIICGLDVCQRLSGSIFKLSALEKVLSDKPEYSSRIVCIQRMVITGSRIEDEMTTSKDLTNMSNALNKTFSGLASSSFNSVSAESAGSFSRSNSTSLDFERADSSSMMNISGGAGGGGAGGGGGEGVGIDDARPSSEFLAGSNIDQLLTFKESISKDYNSMTTGIVDYSELTSVTLQERLALWLASDVLVTTSIKEGLNLNPLEYIYARRGLPHTGAVILSEFSTCSTLLNGSLKVNPYSVGSVADALIMALNMKSEESQKRSQRDVIFIKQHTSSLWSTQILSDLRKCKALSANKRMKSQSANIPEPMNFELLTKSYFDAARVPNICELGTRVFILDYAGTLLPREKFDIYMKSNLSTVSSRSPSPEIVAAIEKLSADKRNIILVVTGSNKLRLGDRSNRTENVTLATGNGLIYSWGEIIEDIKDVVVEEEEKDDKSAGSSRRSRGFSVAMEEYSTTRLPSKKQIELDDSSGRKWQYRNDYNIDWNAVRDIAIPIINKFTFKTNGTTMSKRVPGVGWSFIGSDPEWGVKQAQQLQLELEAALAFHDVKILILKGNVEIVPNELTKGVIVQSLLNRVIKRRAGKLPSFIFAAGDDLEDEPMFESVYSTLQSSTCGLSQCRIFTCAIGKRETSALTYVNGVEDMERILLTFAKAEERTDNDSDM